MLKRLMVSSMVLPAILLSTAGTAPVEIAPVSISTQDVIALDASKLVENPQYASWKDYGIGSTMKTRLTITQGAQNMVISITSKLTKRTDKELTIEQTAELTAGGQKMPPMTENETVPAKAPPSKSRLPKEFDDNFKGKVTDGADEKVTIDGKTFTCKVQNVDGTLDTPQGKGKIKGKVLFHDEIPFGIGGMNLDIDGDDGTKAKMKLEVLDISKK